VSRDPAVDLALVQVDRPGPYPVVAGINAAADAAPEGAPVVTIGYPLIDEPVMEHNGPELVARTTVDPGTVSKRVPATLQIDAYASHGSSGSPVFNARGEVVGVVYGGPAAGRGHVVYAIPGDRLAAFLPPGARAAIR
jgi:S1-C subfamily serine protease